MTPDWSIKCLVPDLPAPEDILPYLRTMHDNRWYSNFGPLVNRFERDMAAFLTETDGRPLHAVAVSSATAALDLMLRAADLPEGAHILLPAVTFPATILTVMNAGYTPVIADVDPVTWDLTPMIATAITASMPIAAVMPVAPFGYGLDIAGWQGFRGDTGLPVFFDAAAVLGQQPVSADMPTAFSLHATKPFGVGEGGLLVTGDADHAARIRRIANFGFDQGVIVEPGGNSKMAEYFAGVALAQMDRWPGLLSRRRALYQFYEKTLAGQGLGDMLRRRPGGVVPATLPLDTRGRARDLMAAFTARGIQHRQWYLPPLHRHPAFADCMRAAETLPVSDRLNDSLVGVPFHGFLTETDIMTVCDTVRTVCA